MRVLRADNRPQSAGWLVDANWWAGGGGPALAYGARYRLEGAEQSSAYRPTTDSNHACRACWWLSRTGSRMTVAIEVPRHSCSAECWSAGCRASPNLLRRSRM